MIKQVLTTLGVVAFGIASYATTFFMQVTTDDGKKTYYNVESVTGTFFCKEEVTPEKPDINHQFEYVDLGLPSGTLWATCNVGATTIGGYGDFFAWGETEPNKAIYSMNNYKWARGLYTYFISLYKYCFGNRDYDYFACSDTIDNLATLLPEDDAATANWGADWRMPTKEEFQELLDYCSREWTFFNGEEGVKFTAPNGHFVFFPAAGYHYEEPYHYQGEDTYVDDLLSYWSSSLCVENEDYAYCLGLGYGQGSSEVRSYGLPVRAVRVEKSSDLPVDTTEISTPVDTTSTDSTDVVLSPYVATFMEVYAGGKTRYEVDHITDVSIVSEKDIEHEYVDLGLPSGTLWATCNVGAMYPEYGGDCFAWGETEAKSYNDWSNYKWAIANDESSYSLTKYGKNDQQTTLLPEDDAATVNWGSDWRMPTKEEVEELIEQCTRVETVDGVKFTGPNGNSVFFPFKDKYSATYWSSSCDKEVAFVMLLNIYAERAAGTFIFHPECEGKNEERAYGRYVRAVRSTP